MQIEVQWWKMWMQWKDYQNPNSPINRFPGCRTIYEPPIERTTLAGIVTLKGQEIRSYKRYLKYIQGQKKIHQKSVAKLRSKS